METKRFEFKHGGETFRFTVTTEHDPKAVAEAERRMAEMAAPKLLRDKAIAKCG